MELDRQGAVLDASTRKHLETVISVELTVLAQRQGWLFRQLTGKAQLDKEAAREEIVKALADMVEQQFEMKRRRFAGDWRSPHPAPRE